MKVFNITVIRKHYYKDLKDAKKSTRVKMATICGHYLNHTFSFQQAKLSLTDRLYIISLFHIEKLDLIKSKNIIPL